MAGENGTDRQPEPRGWIPTVYNAVMRGGEIQAAFFQGISELGQALKAFPDSIQATEAGSVFNPYYGDREAARDDYARPTEMRAPEKAEMLSPGEIARSNASGTVHGETQQVSKPLPSAGEIANDQQPHQPSQENGRQQDQSQGRSV